MSVNTLGTAIPLRRRCYLSLKEIEGRFQLGGTSTNKSNKDCKMPVATDSSTLFLEELEVEHHKDTSSHHNDEESQPEQDHEAFEVIPCRDDHDDMAKKEKGTPPLEKNTPKDGKTQDRKSQDRKTQDSETQDSDCPQKFS